MKRILMGSKAIQDFQLGTRTEVLSYNGALPFAGVPVLRSTYLAPDDIWIEHDDGSWERIAPC